MGNLVFRNRILVPAHTLNYGENRLPSDRHRHYHRARAEGGVGAIIFEGIRSNKNALGRPQSVAGYDRRCIEPFRRIAEDVKQAGAKMLGQIIHQGRQIDGDFERTVSWGPSSVPWSGSARPPHAMDAEDMNEVIRGHVLTAQHLVEAGFDGIELQIGHGHLLQQFLSPLSNVRRDSFGGSLENRQRFPALVLAAMRDAVGDEFCLGFRISADEFVEGGLRIDETEQIAANLASQTKTDFVNVTHSAYQGSHSIAMQMADMTIDPTAFRVFPTRIRSKLVAAGHDIPVFAVCRFTSLEQADQALAAGVADAIGMARAHIADPDLVLKTLTGRVSEVRECIGCNQGCAGMLEKNLAIRCVVNPRAGMEGTWRPLMDSPAATNRRILVIGGGPAGLEAAITAATRGHSVHLWERGPRLGGRLLWLEKLPRRSNFLKLVTYQKQETARHGVTVRLNHEADLHHVADFRPDVVVVATGASPARSPLAGGGRVMTLEDALDDVHAVGPRPAVMDTTGEWSALSVIEYLADVKERVTVFVPIAAFAWQTTIYSNYAWKKRLRDKSVRIALLRRISTWDGHSLAVEDVSTGEVRTHTGFTSVVVAEPLTVSNDIFDSVRDAGYNVHRVGDCVAPRTAMEAVYEGHEIGRAL